MPQIRTSHDAVNSWSLSTLMRNNGETIWQRNPKLENRKSNLKLDKSKLELTTEAVLLVRRIRCAHMHVAQIAQHGLIFFAHAARKIRVIQMLIPC
jgi:hypothetical protein